MKKKTKDYEEHLTLSSSSSFSASLSGDDSGELAPSSASRNAMKSSLLDECTGESVTTLICIIPMQQNKNPETMGSQYKQLQIGNKARGVTKKAKKKVSRTKGSII